MIGGLHMWQIIYPRLKKVALFCLSHWTYILWFLLYFMGSFLILSSNRFMDYGEAFITCVVLYMISIAVALTCGEFVQKLLNGVRPPETSREKDYLLPLFNDVYEDAKELYSDLPRIKIFIIDNLSVNAFALGTHTVAVTQGAINTFSIEELQGIIAHGIAHIYYGDTKSKMLNEIGNGLFSIYVLFVDLFLKVLDLFFIDLDDPDTKDTSTLFRALFLCLRLIINLSVMVTLFLGNVLLSGNERKNELRADRFAHSIGHDEGLKNALYLLQKMSLGENMRFIDRMQQNHPRISKRIEKLEELQEQEQ